MEKETNEKIPCNKGSHRWHLFKGDLKNKKGIFFKFVCDKCGHQKYTKKIDEFLNEDIVKEE